MLQISGLPQKYQKLWEQALPILKTGRVGDDMHAKETVEYILNYKTDRPLNYGVLIPVAMMHDIGHAAILPQHIRLVTGPEKLANSKLVHMLAGAKIAYDLLQNVWYSTVEAVEIVDIISVHDGEQVKGMGREIYNTENKRFFHDVDVLDRFNEDRLERMKSLYSDREEIRKLLEPMIDNFFLDEFKTIAKMRFDTMFSKDFL